MTLTTHAMAFDRFGAADVLAPHRVELPEPGPGQVRVRVRTAAVNPLDWKIRRGGMTELFPVPLPHVPGLEAAGVVEAVGPDVGGLGVGDEVFGRTSTGSYAAHALAEARNLVRRPHALGWAEAAVIPTAAETALRCFAYLGLERGETLLFHAAAGGVGTLALQLAAARGIRVIGTASEHNHAYVRQLGGEPVSYGEGLTERVRRLSPRGVDAAIDGAGRGGSVEASLALTGGSARVVTIVHPDEAARSGVHFSGGGGDWDFAGALAEASALHAAGFGLRLPVHRMYPLADAAAAMAESESGHVRGKVVLVVG
ncbi:NADP-dependent oxidoreductase [Streptomyces tubbatahanensis]|uniref:NADP-dependent oxidoreductase n=1 Tax=Streptomyces tubbatahanensis TaxID=2923272 RepID=A0ABY3XVY7_9ACTN|nr:NADP-dependent oxidoreductase [Streptomyces tubbatahanensis]UNS98508.1 NADP-dependent oxidoreductase [Streptomyces tubbatahanensis]